MLVAWLLFIYVASAEKCEVHQENKKVIKPLASVENGATFLTYSRIDDPAQCHQGCCNSSKCDTSFHTGTRLDTNGDNCFYFHCGVNYCITSQDSTTHFSVATVSRTSESAPLPDFSSIFVTEQVTVKSQDVVVLNEIDKQAPGCVHPTIPNGAVSSDNQTVHIGDQYTVTCSDGFTLNGNVAMVCQDGNTFDQTPTCKDAATLVKIVGSNQDTIPTNVPLPTTQHKEEVTVKNHQSDAQSDIQPLTNEDTKAEDTQKDEPIKPKPSPTEPKPSPTEPPKPKVTLPNEVPAVNVAAAKETTKEKVAEDNNVYENEDAFESKADLKFEVEIHDVHETDDTAYTKKDVIFWVSVVGGSCLILFGLVTIVRVYRNKRRRLYASLTDDYLINGMYSI